MLLMESALEELYSHGADAYKGISSDFERWAKEESNIRSRQSSCWCISFFLISVAQFAMKDLCEGADEKLFMSCGKHD